MLRTLFFGTRMTWRRVTAFAVISAVVTAICMTVPFIAHTSIANIGETFECWILFALIIILNCDKPVEAGLKTFVFFLISQPLIYLLQVPFSWQHWGLFQYYPRWLILTVLCLPGGMLAWFVKKDAVYSALILSVATGFLAVQGVWFVQQMCVNPPHELIAILFSAALIPVLILTALRRPLTRWIAAALTVAAAAGGCLLL